MAIDTKLKIQEFKDQFSQNGLITTSEVVDFYKKFEPSIPRATVNWRVYELVNQGILERVGKGKFKIGKSKKYQPGITTKLFKINKPIRTNFPLITYCLWQQQWINDFSQHIAKIGVVLVEGLVESELKFVFKGGAAVMLLVGSTKRLSIDVDIIIDAKTNLDEQLKSIAESKGFIRCKLHERSSDFHIEKERYKFYYNPIIKSNQTEDNILLDILFEKPLYNKTIQTAIDSKFVKQEGESLKVTTPDFDNILGDKLTACAPETTGIPYERNGQSMAMEIIKQL